ncbi:MAG: ABC transporter substrate-binding protein [Dehalococcoidia bacterium]
MDEANYWQQSLRARVSRRGVLRGGALGTIGFGSILAGCSSSKSKSKSSTGTVSNASSSTNGGTPGPGSAAAVPSVADPAKLTLEQYRSLYSGSRFKGLAAQKDGPKRGGTLHYSSRTPVNWDPTGPAGSLLSSFLYAHNQLLEFEIDDAIPNPNLMQVKPVLAKAMPEQPDELTYIFKLQQGVKFQNVPPVPEREFTSADVAFCSQAYQKAPAQAPTFEDLDQIQTPDQYTVVYKMKRPAAYFLGTFVIPFHWIFAREQYEAPGGIKAKPIGTGPFLFKSAENLGNYSFVRNPNYWRKDPVTNQPLPYLDGLEGVFYATPAQQYAAFRSGSFEHVWPQNFQAWLDLVKSNPDSVTQVTTPPPSYQPFIAMRIDKPPLNDVRVRRALSLAVDRDAIIKSLAQGMAGYGYGQDWTYFDQEWPWTADQLGPWNSKADPKQAKDLLKAAGFANGIPDKLEFLLTSFAGFNFEVYNAVAAQWQDIGVQTTINAPQDLATWQKPYYSGTYNAFAGTGLIGPGWDPDAFAYHALYSKSPRNYFHVDDPAIDELVVKQRQTLDRTARQQILKQIMQKDLDQVTRIWTVTPYKINMRKPFTYNLVDTEAAWNPVGWGSLGLETAWINK